MSELQTVSQNSKTATLPPPDLPLQNKPVRKRLPKRLKVVKRKKPDSLRRSRLLRRKSVRFDIFAQMVDGEVYINYDHIRYFWASYKRGAFDELEEDMDVQTFTGWLVERMTSGVHVGGEAVTLFGKTPEHGEIPLALFVIDYHGELAYPDVVWSPDASARTKMEGTAAFLLQVKRRHLALLKVGRKHEPLFNHLCKYGIVRKIGKVRDWLGDGKHIMLYQSVGH